MIKAVIFDIGGVYFDWNYVDFLNESYRKLNINRHVTAEDKPAFTRDLLRGKMTIEEAIPIFMDEELNDEQVRTIKDFWISSLTPNSKMRYMVRSLKKRYRLGMLSNSEKCASEKKEAEGAFDDFEIRIFSHKIGMIKPEEGIYRLALEKLGAKPDECVFIDDQERNVVASEKMGIKSILFKNPAQCEEELRKLSISF